MSKFISWNVNGLRAAVDKGFWDYFDAADADIFCLQEIKLSEGQFDTEKEGYHVYWNYALKKGYSGTAIFSKKEPISVTYGIGIEERLQIHAPAAFGRCGGFVIAHRAVSDGVYSPLGCLCRNKDHGT